jgi:hypothetical protein
MLCIVRHLSRSNTQNGRFKALGAKQAQKENLAASLAARFYF